MKKSKYNSLFKNVLTLVLPFTLCIALFGLIYLQYLTQVPEKKKTVLLNDSYDSTTAVIESGNTAEQIIEIDGPLYSLGLNIDIGGATEGHVNLTVENRDTEEVYGSTDIDFAYIFPAYYSFVTLDNPLTDNSLHRIKVTVTPEYAGEPALSIAKSSQVADGFYSLTVNNLEEDGSFAVITTSDVLGTAPLKMYLLVAVIGSIFASVFMFFIPKAKSRMQKALAAFCVILVTGFLYQIAMPPQSAPDEIIHFGTAYSLSNKLIGVESGQGSAVLMRRCDVTNTFMNIRPTGWTYRDVINGIHTSPSEQDLELIALDLDIGGYPVPRLIPAIAILTGRLLKLNGIVMAYFARLFVLVFFAFFIALSVYIARDSWTGTAGLLAVSLLPITLHICGSFSYDSSLVAVAMMMIALYSRCRYSDKPDDIALICLSVLCVIVAPLKSAYGLLILLLWLLPKEKISRKLKAIRPVTTVLSVLNFIYYNTGFLRWTAQKNAVSDVVSESIIQGTVEEVAATVNVYALHEYSITYLLRHPGIFAKLIMNTFFRKFPDYLYQLFGGKLGYLEDAEVAIVPAITVLFVLLVLFAFISNGNEKYKPSVAERIVFGIIFIGTIGLLVAGCITWTTTNYDYIWGFQARYLLPVLPLAMLQINTPWLTKKGDGFAPVLCIGYILNIMAVINAMVVVMYR